MHSEPSPESETLSGDFQMSKRIPTEIRQQVLQLLKQGSRSRSISHQLGINRNTVNNWQAMFDRGDVSWVTAPRHHWTEQEAWQAVELFKSGMSYKAAGHAMGMHDGDVRRYVRNIEKYGVPILKRGRPAKHQEVKHMPGKSRKLRKESSATNADSKTHTEKEYREMEIMLESLVAAINEHLGGTEGSKNNMKGLPFWML
jgi:transposase